MRAPWQGRVTAMSTSAAQATAFFAEAIREGSVWGIRDDGGFPAPLNADGVRAMPFWSLKSRVEQLISNIPAYAAFVPVEIPLVDWRERWLTKMESDGFHVGLNWSGNRAAGYDISPADVEARLATADDG